MTNKNIKPSSKNSLLHDNDLLYRIASFQYNETLQDLMESDVYTCKPEDSVQSVAEDMAKKKISSVIVSDEHKRLLGIVTERDMVRRVITECREQGFKKIIAEIMTPDPVSLPPEGTLFDALSVITKYSIKHLPIVQNNRVAGIVTLRQLMKVRYAEPFIIIGELEKAASPTDFKVIRNHLVHLSQEKLKANTDPADIVTMLSLVNRGIHKRLRKQSIEDMGTPPPVDFCFFVTGSHGRKENLLFPDQDFCVITEDYPDSSHEEYDRYFYEVSKNFSDKLDAAGFPYCTGKIMGQNPQWRKRISLWKEFIADTFKRQGPFTVRYMTLIFDSARLYGTQTLFDTYINHAFDLVSQNHNILRQIHEEEEGVHKVPLGLFHRFITEKDSEHKGEIDMKRSALLFIIETARILALKHNVRKTSTLGRIKELVKKNVIHKDESEYFENAYRVILYHTLNAQAENYLTKSENTYYLSPHKLSHRNQEMLKEAFKAVSTLQDIVAQEFGEL